VSRSITTLRTGELLQLCEEMHAQREVLERYPLTAPYVALLAESSEAIVAAATPEKPAMPPRERAALEREVAAFNATFDHEVRALHGLLDALAGARPERAALYRGCSETLFPTGRRLTTTSPRNKAGQAARLAKLRKRKAIRDALSTRIDDEPLDEHLGRLIIAARGLSSGLLRLAPAKKTRSRARSNRQLAARSRLIGLISQLRATTATARWSDEEFERVFGPLDALTR
jgi:hypothetical protein